MAWCRGASSRRSCIGLRRCAPAAVPLSASLNLTSMNIGGALSALVGGLVLENLGYRLSRADRSAIAAVVALVIAYIAPDHR